MRFFHSITLYAILIFFTFFVGKEVHSKISLEYELKMIFIYRFSKFIAWPIEGIMLLNICIFGKDISKSSIEEISKNNENFDNMVKFKIFSNTEPLLAFSKCNVVFITKGNKTIPPSFIDQLHNVHILTVGESSNFMKAGGIITFFIKQKEVRFNINEKAAKSSGLNISSKLLKLGAG